MKKIVILGGGESGCGSAILAKIKGMETFLSDFGAIAPGYATMLDQYGIPYEQGRHTESRILDADEVVKSPGIPETAPIVVKIREAGIPVISEIEFAGRYTTGRTICITGSNGKTTTTTMVGDILRAAGYDVAVGGNIGSSFALTVATGDKPWHVLELSSFQLDGIETFRPDISVITNITPDHLDRYDHKFENYAASKFRIIMNQRPGDFFICGADCDVVRDETERRSPDVKILPFTAADMQIQGSVPGQGASMDRSGIFRASVGDRSVTIDTGRMRIKGLHNAYNAMAAALASLAAGVAPEAVERTLYDFGGVEHRMEPVATDDGVEWINDSKGTNVDSTWYALGSMTRPTVWIAGGTDKGNDYAPLMEFARDKVKALVCLGVDNRKLLSSFGGTIPTIVETRSMHDAVMECRRLASTGDTVLLSPACASFDLFRNYEDRGRQFKSEVAAQTACGTSHR